MRFRTPADKLEFTEETVAVTGGAQGIGYGWFRRGEGCHRGNFDSVVTIHFLRALREDFDEELIVVLDNAPYFASEKFAENAGIELCTLPQYSPQLDPVEEC